MRSLLRVRALLYAAPLLVGCSTASIYRATDVVTVADDPGAVILPRVPGDAPRPAVFEPYRARATWEALEPVAEIPGERSFALEVVGDGGASRGRIHLRLYPGQTRDGRQRVERSRVVRCESDDSGAWYFDGEMARVRLPRDGVSWLVWQLGHASRFELDDRLLEGSDSRWEGGLLVWEPGPVRRVRTAHWEFEVEAGAGFCLQFAEEPGGPDCEVSAVGELARIERDGVALSRGDRETLGVGEVLEVEAADGAAARVRVVRRLAPGARMRIRVSRGGPAPVPRESPTHPASPVTRR